MRTALSVKASIARSLLIQLCITEIVSLIFFTRIGAIVFAGIIAPLCGVAIPFIALWDWSHLPAASAWLLIGCIAVLLLCATLIAWLRFGSRLSAHAGFALYSLCSVLVLLGLK